MKVLVVDDSPSSLAYHGELMRRMGLDCVAVGDGMAAIARYHEDKPDFVLLDVEMPGMDGFEVARRIRSGEHPDEWTPIIFLSALTNEESLSRGIAAGGDDYLTKPVSEIVLACKFNALRRISRIRETLVTRTRLLIETNAKLNEANNKLETMVAVDGLTGIANRRRFDEVLEREWARGARERTPLSLLMVDVDYFKLYNDTYGHQTGDECLKDIARALAKAVLRPADLAARYGGEEFAVVLPNTLVEGACHVARRFMDNLAALGRVHAASKVAAVVTASVGVASGLPHAQKDRNAATLLKLADRALYEAKQRGRARVVWSEASHGSPQSP